MNITELVHRHTEHRRVGIAFPDRIPVIATAKRLYIDYGIACDIEDNTISIRVPHIVAAWYMGAFERITGRMAFNEWESDLAPTVRT